MKDHSQPENFRPISLLNTLSKLCERVIQIRVNRWLLNNNIITNYQSGFSKGKQTNDHLFRFIESTLVGFNRGLSKGLKTGSIFIDIEKHSTMFGTTDCSSNSTNTTSRATLDIGSKTT